MDLSKFDGHTSGPWVSQDASQPDCPFFYVRVAATGEWIVMVCDTEKRGHESTEANAALIAAAPDLLAEVRRLREVLVNLAAPCEAILMDGESRKWISPEVWSAIESAAAQIRAELVEGSV